jgi:hypothetical protein
MKETRNTDSMFVEKAFRKSLLGRPRMEVTFKINLGETDCDDGRCIKHGLKY